MEAVAQNQMPVEKKKSKGKLFVVLFVVAILLLSNVFLGILYKNTLDLKAELSGTLADLNSRNGFLNGQLQKIRQESGNSHTRVATCSKDTCLFKSADSLEGFARVNGKVITYTALNDKNVETACNAIKVTFGNNDLLNEMRGLAAGGNSSVKLNEEDQLVINVDLEKLSKADQQILSTNPDTEIGFLLIRKTLQGTDKSGCVNIADIISIND